ncbi:MAG: hypothetical protein MUC38_14070 [Cyclobacteriaceae bacterium]|jgi:hypothetical protein|nr:hypothetical protein [Cyclobacteriaceae bacterium]
MNWRRQQRVLERVAIGVIVAGVVLMYAHRDPHHHVIYAGFMLTGVAKLTEAVYVVDPTGKIIKITACLCILVLGLIHFATLARTIGYMMVPLLVYYFFHYRLWFKSRTHE